MEQSMELMRYQELLQNSGENSQEDEAIASKLVSDELRMAPLLWWGVQEHSDQAQEEVQRGYAVLGHVHEAERSHETEPSMASLSTLSPVFLNTDTPWSAFLCGSQGSGKSHTLSCMLENCLLADESSLQRIGKNPHPLAGLVLHYDRCQGSGVCEAAYLCTHISTTVLVSPSNYGRLKKTYEDMAKTQNANIIVKQLYVLPKYLDTERMKTLMAVGKEDEVPLYMQVGFPFDDFAQANHVRLF